MRCCGGGRAGASPREALALALRSRIVSGCAEGLTNEQVAAREQVSRSEDVGEPATPAHPGGAAHVERIMRHNGLAGAACVLAALRAPPSVTRPRPGRRTWWAGGGGSAHPICCP